MRLRINNYKGFFSGMMGCRYQLVFYPAGEAIDGAYSYAFTWRGVRRKAKRLYAVDLPKVRPEPRYSGYYKMYEIMEVNK